MKVCLISALARLDCAPGELEASFEDAPLGPLTLAAILRERGCEVTFVDLDREYAFWSGERKGDFVVRVAESLACSAAGVFGFSSVCGSYPQTLRISKHLKALRPDCTVVLGGPQASVTDVATIREFPHVDVIVRGEADESFPSLIDALANNRGHLDLIPGLTWRRNAQIHRTCDGQPVADLDALPLPAYDLYTATGVPRNAGLELGRGCPFACSFCSTNDFFRRKFRLKSPEVVIGQMRQLNALYAVENFSLVHDMFTVDRRRVVEFCEAMRRAATGFQWSCSARTDCVDKDLLRLMKDAGCDGVFYGIETGSQPLQKTIGKNLRIPEARAIVQATTAAGIPCTASAITGFPEENIQDLRDTVDFLIEAARGDDVEAHLHMLAPLAGTPIANRFKAELVLDRSHSDISTSAVMSEEEWGWIENSPAIFSSFYHVPSPALERTYVLAACRFVRCGLSSFRWLMIALHALRGHVLDVFDEWLAWSGPRGLSDRVNAFVDFAAERYREPAILAVIDFYREFHRTRDRRRQAPELSVQDSAGPAVTDGSVVLALPYSLTEWLQHMRRGTLRDFVPGTPETVAVVSRGKRLRILSLHPLQASLAGLCNGVRDCGTISELADWKAWTPVPGASRKVVTEIVLDSLVKAGVLTAPGSSRGCGA